MLWIEISAEAPGRRLDLAGLKNYLSGNYRFYRAEALSSLLTI